MKKHQMSTLLGQLGLSLLTATCMLAAQAQTAPDFVKGADVGWVSEQEASGYKFYNRRGVRADPFVMLRDLHINTIRLRVWVNPTDGWNNQVDVLAKAKRAAALGQRIMINFHYSDSWADPGQQNKPADWTSHSLEQLKANVARHTVNTLRYLKDNGIGVEFVQVGNEINGGMLWPSGSFASFDNLAGLINSGYSATKSVYPDAKVIVHLANGYKTEEFHWFFSNLHRHGGQWDITGMSHYPPVDAWAQYNQLILRTMTEMIKRYSKPVMVVEVGMAWDQGATAKGMLQDLIAKTRTLGANGLGVIYWEPQGHPGWKDYQFGAMDKRGRFTVAMEAFE